MLVRFVAAAIIGMSGLLIALYVADSLAHHLEVGPLHCVLLGLPAVAGVAILVKAAAIAAWLSEKLDE